MGKKQTIASFFYRRFKVKDCLLIKKGRKYVSKLLGGVFK